MAARSMSPNAPKPQKRALSYLLSGVYLERKTMKHIWQLGL